MSYNKIIQFNYSTIIKIFNMKKGNFWKRFKNEKQTMKIDLFYQVIKLKFLLSNN